jgi:hypothetical protein
MKQPATAAKNRVGRPHVRASPEQVRQLRCQGVSWRRIAKLLGIGSATAMRLLRSTAPVCSNIEDARPKTLDRVRTVSDSRLAS